MGQYRDGAPVTVEGVSVILASIDRIKQILSGLERDGTEPPGSDADLIGRLQMLALGNPGIADALDRQSAHGTEEGVVARQDLPPVQAARDELERAWRAAPNSEAASQNKDALSAIETNARETQARAQTVRVSVDTLEH